MVDQQSCEHPAWEYAVAVQELPGQTTTATRFYTNELSIRCAVCHGHMQFALGAAHVDMPWADGTLASGTVVRLRGSVTPPLLTAQRVWQAVVPGREADEEAERVLRDKDPVEDMARDA